MAFSELAAAFLKSLRLAKSASAAWTMKFLVVAVLSAAPSLADAAYPTELPALWPTRSERHSRSRLDVVQSSTYCTALEAVKGATDARHRPIMTYP
jgi:hypothetical protein